VLRYRWKGENTSTAEVAAALAKALGDAVVDVNVCVVGQTAGKLQ